MQVPVTTSLQKVTFSALLPTLTLTLTLTLNLTMTLTLLPWGIQGIVSNVLDVLRDVSPMDTVYFW